MELIIDAIINYKFYVILFLSFILLFFITYKLKSEIIIKKFILESIKEVETYLNSEIGQNKIDIIEEKLKDKVHKMPIIFRLFFKIFITKYWIVTTIESLLNLIQDQFDEEAKDIDILGNEANKKKELN